MYIERERLVPVPVAVPVPVRDEFATYRYVDGPKRLPAPSPVRRPAWQDEERDRELDVRVRVTERERDVEGGGYRREREYYGR